MAASARRSGRSHHQSRATSSLCRDDVVSAAPVCAISPSRLARASRPTCARSASVGALDRLRRRSVKAGGNGDLSATRTRVAIVGQRALFRASAPCPGRTAAGGRARPSSRSRYRRISRTRPLLTGRDYERVARRRQGAGRGRDGRDASVEIDGHAGCSFGACCLRPTRESTPAASMRAASCRSMARPRRRHGRHACDRWHAVQQPGDGGRSRRA